MKWLSLALVGVIIVACGGSGGGGTTGTDGSTGTVQHYPVGTFSGQCWEAQTVDPIPCTIVILPSTTSVHEVHFYAGGTGYLTGTISGSFIDVWAWDNVPVNVEQNRIWRDKFLDVRGGDK